MYMYIVHDYMYCVALYMYRIVHTCTCITISIKNHYRGADAVTGDLHAVHSRKSMYVQCIYMYMSVQSCRRGMNVHNTATYCSYNFSVW